jgi:ATP-dependent DNA helicase RecG
MEDWILTQLIEGDIFRMIISVPEFGEKPSNTLVREAAEVSSRPELGPESRPESIFERVIKGAAHRCPIKI